MKPKRTVADLKEGESAYVSVLDENIYTCKLLNLGLLPRAQVTMVRQAPFGDACYIRLDGYQLAMRRNEAKTIYIEEG